MPLHRSGPRALLACVASLVSACTQAPTGRLETRASIAGRVVLADVPGLNDLSRVVVEFGQGAGSGGVDENGEFHVQDLEPDVYPLRITYTGGLTPAASGSAYRPYTLSVTADQGGSVNLGAIELELGRGTILGTVAADQGDPEGALVTLRGVELVRQTEVTSGAFNLSDVPVGYYTLGVEKPGFAGAGGGCAASLAVEVDGDEVGDTDITLRATQVRLEPGSGDTHDWDEDTWFLTGDSVSVVVSASFATHARAWPGGEGAPAYQALGGRWRSPACPTAPAPGTSSCATHAASRAPPTS